MKHWKTTDVKFQCEASNHYIQFCQGSGLKASFPTLGNLSQIKNINIRREKAWWGYYCKYLQSILIIHRSRICALVYSLKFICNPKIHSHCKFWLQSTCRIAKTLESTYVHVASWNTAMWHLLSFRANKVLFPIYLMLGFVHFCAFHWWLCCQSGTKQSAEVIFSVLSLWRNYLFR